MQTLKPKVALYSTNRFKGAAIERIRGDTWRRIRNRWLSDNPLCIDCTVDGRITAAEELDHIIPLWAGGKDHEGNYASRCKACHAIKTAREAGERHGKPGAG